jgi:hypothetical protein
MVELIRIADPVSLQILCDALAERGVVFRVDNAGMNALMPLPGVMDARILVEENDMGVAKQILNDLEMGG